MKKSRVEAVRGSAMITAICLVGGLLIFSLGFLLLPWQEYLLNHRAGRGTSALNLAEAGVDYAFYTLTSTARINAWSGTNPKTKTVTGFQTSAGEVVGDFSMSVQDPTAANPLITSTGYVPSKAAADHISRTVKAKLKGHPFHPFTSGVFLGISVVELKGGTTTDSYDSRLGTYGQVGADPYNNIHRGGAGAPDEGKANIQSDGTITLVGTTSVYGDLQAAGAIASGGALVAGTVIQDAGTIYPNGIPPVDVPIELTTVAYGIDGAYTTGRIDLKSNLTIPSGDYRLRSIKMASDNTITINGPARIYLEGYLNAGALTQTGGTIICTGKVEIWTADDFSSGGNGLDNTSGVPSNLWVYGTSTCDLISLTGGSSVSAVVYAPNADIIPSGGGERFGAYAGKSVKLVGGGLFHYDEALDTVAMSTYGYELEHWQEKS